MKSQDPSIDPSIEGGTLTAAAISLAVVLILAGGAWIVVPLLLPRRPPANGAAAIGSLKAIANAQYIYREGDKDGDGRLAYTGNLKELGELGLIDEILASGTKQGYYFTIGAGSEPEFVWWAKASPTVPGVTGDRFFYVNLAGEIFYSTHDFPVIDPTSDPEGDLRRLSE